MTQTAATTDSKPCTRALYIAFDMGKDAWQFACCDGGKARREGKIVRTDVEQGKRDLLLEIAKAVRHFGLPDDVKVHAMYEAGRDGFWFARWLDSTGVDCLVVDPCCILVDRRAKQRKNDAIDARALLDLLVRHVTGDREVNVVPVPPPEAEDARELGRLLHRLGRVRRSLACRVQSVLWTRGIDEFYRTGLQDELSAMRSGDGRPLDRVVRLEVEMLCGQIEHIDRDMAKLEQERVAQVEKPTTPAQQQAHQLEQLVGIGPIGAWTLAHELFSWRQFRNGKALGAYPVLCGRQKCGPVSAEETGAEASRRVLPAPRQVLTNRPVRRAAPALTLRPAAVAHSPSPQQKRPAVPHDPLFLRLLLARPNLKTAERLA